MSFLDDTPAAPRAWGLSPVTARGSMPFALLDGEPLVALASEALERAGVDLLDFDADLAAVALDDRPLVVHDPLCPLTPVPFLREAVATAVGEDVVVVAVQPVTDTIKAVRDQVVRETVDRDRLWRVVSPVVLPARVVSRLDRWSDTDDPVRLVAHLRAHEEVRFLPAPSLARRVDDASSLVLLEALAAQVAAEPHPEGEASPTD